MANKLIKQIMLFALFGAFLFVSNVWAQTNTCAVRLRVFSFVTGSIETSPAARASRFRPTLLNDAPVKVEGIVVYNYQ
jgi:hypothetical protein